MDEVGHVSQVPEIVYNDYTIHCPSRQLKDFQFHLPNINLQPGNILNVSGIITTRDAVHTFGTIRTLKWNPWEKVKVVSHNNASGRIPTLIMHARCLRSSCLDHVRACNNRVMGIEIEIIIK